MKGVNNRYKSRESDTTPKEPDENPSTERNDNKR